MYHLTSIGSLPLAHRHSPFIKVFSRLQCCSPLEISWRCWTELSHVTTVHKDRRYIEYVPQALARPAVEIKWYCGRVRRAKSDVFPIRKTPGYSPYTVRNFGQNAKSFVALWIAWSISVSAFSTLDKSGPWTPLSGPDHVSIALSDDWEWRFIKYIWTWTRPWPFAVIFPPGLRLVYSRRRCQLHDALRIGVVSMVLAKRSVKTMSCSCGGFDFVNDSLGGGYCLFVWWT